MTGAPHLARNRSDMPATRATPAPQAPGPPWIPVPIRPLDPPSPAVPACLAPSSRPPQTQGVKTYMEDSHVMAALDPANGVQPVTGPVMPQQQVSMAGVFDGHSGPCTARYAAKNFPTLLHSALSRQHQQRGEQGGPGVCVWGGGAS